MRTDCPATSFAIVSRNPCSLATSASLRTGGVASIPCSADQVCPAWAAQVASELRVGQQVRAVVANADGVEEVLHQPQAAGCRREPVSL